MTLEKSAGLAAPLRVATFRMDQGDELLLTNSRSSRSLSVIFDGFRDAVCADEMPA
jgi:hypothetical protein